MRAEVRLGVLIVILVVGFSAIGIITRADFTPRVPAKGGPPGRDYVSTMPPKPLGPDALIWR